MARDVASPANGSWTDVLGEGRLPVFALICLGVWLNAADSLVTATIMPSVGKALGGYAYFGWATAGFLLGSVMAGASSGLLAQRFGLARATAVSALLYSAGCALSAWAPDMTIFLIGRALQGVGGGWVAGFSSVAIGVLFPDRTLARVYAAVTSVWGIATLVGPLLGGVFADAGAWRWVFWFFAIQGVALAGLALVLLPKAASDDSAKVAWPQLGLIGAGVACIGWADMAGSVWGSAGLTFAGLGLLGLMVAFDARAGVRLLPRGAHTLASTPGAGYATMFLMTAASMGFSVYGPAILQTLRGYSALVAGYVIAVEALAWTGFALVVTHLTGPWPGRMIRLGAIMVTVGLAVCALGFAHGPFWVVILGGSLLGGGFGLAWSFMAQQVLVALPGEERAVGAAGTTTVRLTGSAAGAAVAAVIANVMGFAQGLTPQAAEAASLWVFAVATPIAGLAIFTAWRLGEAQSAEAANV